MWSTVAASECKQKSALKRISFACETECGDGFKGEAKNDSETSGHSDCVTVGAVC